MVKTYRCPSCGEFEHECNITDIELKVCPKCHKEVIRVYKTASYSFKTDGFAGKGF